MTTQAAVQLPESATDHDRRWDRLLARAMAPYLDRQLAAGRPAGSRRVMAARARQIVSPAEREEAARHWYHVLNQASRPPVPRSPRAPLRRDQVASAERDVREMLTVLAGPMAIAARGAGMASLLLSDGTGPLYNRRSPVDLSEAVREATRLMDPLAAGPVQKASHRRHAH